MWGHRALLLLGMVLLIGLLVLFAFSLQWRSNAGAVVPVAVAGA